MTMRSIVLIVERNWIGVGMSDLISREKLLDVIKPMVGMWDEGTFWIDYKRVIDIIENEPSVEPERKSGEWLEKEVFDNVDYEILEWQSEKCSVCGKYHTTPYLYNFRTFEYCPNCGSKKTGGEDGKA